MKAERLIQSVGLMALLAGAPATAAPPPETTDLNDLIMYAINNDPPVQLMRYSFAAETYMVIGDLIDQYGNAPIDLECLTYVPSGPQKGFYAASNMDDEDEPAVLYKIDPLTGACYKYSNDIGYEYVVGMVPHYDGSEWSILATHGRNGAKRLLRIDLITGTGISVMALNECYEGLAKAANGTLFAIARDGGDARLYIIDPITGNEIAVGARQNHGKVESLEFAFGDLTDEIDTEGVVPPNWTKDGVLLSFSDDSNEFVIINPETGATAVYSPPFLADSATDAEGLVFFTSRTDPFGEILAEVFD